MREPKLDCAIKRVVCPEFESKARSAGERIVARLMAKQRATPAPTLKQSIAIMPSLATRNKPSLPESREVAWGNAVKHRDPKANNLFGTRAKAAGMSRFHFHRVFKAHTGVTPKAYADTHRGQRMQQALTRSESVT